MNQRHGDVSAVSLSERRWATADGLLGAVLLALGAALLGLGLLEIGAGLLGSIVHPDAILLPLIGSVVALGFGALLRVAATAMRRGARNRWTVQWMVLLMPLVLAVFVGLSFL